MTDSDGFDIIACHAICCVYGKKTITKLTKNTIIKNLFTSNSLKGSYVEIIVVLCVILVLYFFIKSNFYGIAYKITPSFNPHINPFRKEKELKEYLDYENNDFQKFYKPYLSQVALQECYKKYPEWFLDKDSFPMVIESYDELPKWFEDKYFTIPIGCSHFTSNAHFTNLQRDAVLVGIALRVKVILCVAKLPDENEAMLGQRAEITALFLLSVEKDRLGELRNKCPMLHQEIIESIQKRQETLLDELNKIYSTTLGK